MKLLRPDLPHSTDTFFPKHCFLGNIKHEYGLSLSGEKFRSLFFFLLSSWLWIRLARSHSPDKSAWFQPGPFALCSAVMSKTRSSWAGVYMRSNGGWDQVMLSLISVRSVSEKQRCTIFQHKTYIYFCIRYSRQEDVIFTACSIGDHDESEK